MPLYPRREHPHLTNPIIYSKTSSSQKTTPPTMTQHQNLATVNGTTSKPKITNRRPSRSPRTASPFRTCPPINVQEASFQDCHRDQGSEDGIVAHTEAPKSRKRPLASPGSLRYSAVPVSILKSMASSLPTRHSDHTSLLTVYRSACTSSVEHP